MAGIGLFKLAVMNPDKMIYEGDAAHIFLPGETGEFELLPYHYPVLSLLKAGNIIVDWKYSIAVKKGLVKFFKNDCVVIVELEE